MEIPGQPTQQPQTVQISSLLHDYDERKKKELISLEQQDGKVVLIVKRFDEHTGEPSRPMVVPINEHQIEKLAIDADRQKAELRMQIAMLNETLGRIDADLKMLPKLKKDLAKLSEE